MNEYRKSSHDCVPTDHPAPQPHPPGDGEACKPLPETTPPKLDPPEKCPPPDPCCECPTPPGSSPNCLEELLAKQGADISAGDHAKEFQKDLTALLAAAKDAATKYTRDTYERLVDDWVKQDAAIAELIRKLVCAVPCWRCILDCYVCPLLNDLHYAEKVLYDDGKLYTTLNDIQDLEYWLTRDKAAKQRTFNRIDSVMKAWSAPADTIQKALAANKTAIELASSSIGTEPGKSIYSVFLQIIPLHLAIAPPAGSHWTTKIDENFTKFCECDKGTPDYCCGPDVGELSLRQRLVPPQAYLVDPSQYFMLICCLVENRYAPAKDALGKVTADLAAVTARIANLKKQLEDGLKNFGQTANGAIPSVIDCCKYEKDDDDRHGSSQSS